MEDIERLVKEVVEINARIDKRLEALEQLLKNDIELTNKFIEKLNKIGEKDGE